MSNNTPAIPFVRSGADDTLAREIYAAPGIWRVALERDQTLKNPPPGIALWIDIGFDGVLEAFGSGPPEWTADWKQYVNRHGDLSFIKDSISKPDRKLLTPIICAALNEANRFHPTYLSVPQLPHLDGTEHNKINKLLFQITTDWHESSASKAKLILPVIFTHCRQLNKKTDRNPKIKFIASLLANSSVNSVWSVDASLEDQLGTGNFARERFPGIIDFFKELKAVASLEMTIAGPYWGLGLVLWSRGLVSHFGVGVGSTYRYHTPGGRANTPRTRIAPQCLRRWVSASPDLKDWLINSAAKLPSNSPEQSELRTLASQFPSLLDLKIAKRQVARAHKNWCQKIALVAESGRAVALFQDLSSAFVTGKSFDPLPDDDGPVRRPELVAEQLMLNCL